MGRREPGACLGLKPKEVCGSECCDLATPLRRRYEITGLRLAVALENRFLFFVIVFASLEGWTLATRIFVCMFRPPNNVVRVFSLAHDVLGTASVIENLYVKIK